MADSLLERYWRPALAAVILVLAVLSAVSGYQRLETQGVAAVGDLVVDLYIAGLVVWGLVVEGFETDRFRVLLYLGLVFWGVVDVMVGTVTAFSVVFLVLGGGAARPTGVSVRPATRDPGVRSVIGGWREKRTAGIPLSGP